ncbi:hypothetical protein HPP92_015536 [Vanilla planifolia]|uniref:O-fucosyltransferase family protein n=1 Tax=Vanilla planifolia TaxID=51239 RepID=A0A835US53_VANPL|nr:hypothetical protein HPP92_015536 [Vanilla planifolia]
MDADNSSDGLASVWKHTNKAGGWKPCINTNMNGLPESNGYIYVEANGGLNQQRTSICNAVAVAGYLNATLLIPNFHFHSIWRDPSKFSDIYDEDHFITTLQHDVRVVDKIPEYIMERFGHNVSNVHNFKIKAWSSVRYYKDMVLPKLIEEKFIRISPFANRLSFDSPSAVQRLRCLANFEALRFSKPISTLAGELVSRMKALSVDNSGKYIAVHLRFEEGKEVGEEKFTKPGRVIRPGVIRINGKCPLTPLEVGLMLRGMGFSNNTLIYLASGKIYQGRKDHPLFLKCFLFCKLKRLWHHQRSLLPLSEVFVTTQGGNFPHFLIGHRRYLNGGHSKTIKPDKRKLAVLFANPNIGKDGQGVCRIGIGIALGATRNFREEENETKIG